MKENKRKDMTYYITEVRHSLDMLERYMSARTDCCLDCMDDATVHRCAGCSKGAERLENILNDPRRICELEHAHSISQLVDLGNYLRAVSDIDKLQILITGLRNNEVIMKCPAALSLQGVELYTILEYIDGYLEELKAERDKVMSDGKD